MLSRNEGLITSILDVLRHQPETKLAILFGSMATDQHRADSDLDIALDLGRVMSAEDRIALISSLAEKTGRPIDLIDLRTAGEPLLGQVLKHGIRILGGNAAYAALISRHLLDAADFLPYRDRILKERRRAWIGK